MCIMANKSSYPMTFAISSEIRRVRCGRRDCEFEVLIDPAYRYTKPSVELTSTIDYCGIFNEKVLTY